MPIRRYFGCKVSPRGVGRAVDYVMFVARTNDVMAWSGVRRVGEHEQGTQRILKKPRVRAIERFLTTDARNMIPLSVTVAFGPGVASFETIQEQIDSCLEPADTQNMVEDLATWGFLSFDFETEAAKHLRPALIVDGQHRLHGMAGVDGEDIPVLIVALIDATPDEQAFQFVVINNKSAKVPTDNVKAIIATIHEADLRERLLKAGVDYGNTSATLRDINDQVESPFQGLLIWPLSGEGQGIIQLTTVEACLRFVRNQFPGLRDDVDTQKEIFYAVWQEVKEHYNNLWLNNEKFMSKVNINALNEFIVERLAVAYENFSVDVYELEQVHGLAHNIVSAIPQEFWLNSWTRVLQDNTVVREIIKADLRIIMQNRRARGDEPRQWYTGLELIGGVPELVGPDTTT